MKIIINKIKELKLKINAQTLKESILLVILYLVISSLFLTFLVCYSQYRNLPDVIVNLSSNTTNALLTFMFIFVLNSGIYLICSSLFATLIFTFIPVSVLSLINYVKYYYRQEVLVPTDFLQIHEAFNIVNSSVKVNFSLYKLMGIIFVFIVLLFVIFFIKKVKVKIPVRIFSLIALPFIVYLYVFSSSSLVNKLIPSHISENVIDIYDRKGFLLGFLSEIPYMILEKPSNYTADNVKKIYNLMSEKGTSIKSVENNGVKPNIIVILSEAFTDPTKLSGVTYSIDPLVSIREYMNNDGYLNLISPQIGGGTANVEYEVLTGVSVSLFNESAIAYQQYINQSHFSLANYLNGMGYVSLGIHPYYDWFWRRNKVYPYLGFRDFYSMDEMRNKSLMGPYISDLSLSKEIIDKYEENNGSPLFISAVSMQNHSLYNVDRYTDEQIKVTVESNKISDGFKQELTEYVNGVYYASEALKYLINYFENVDEPTYIFMYGDHCPYFADYVDEYYDILGYKSESKLDYLLSMTPAIFWSNQDKDKIDFDRISPFLLGKEMLKYANVELPDYFKVLEKFDDNIKVVNGGFIIDSNNNFIYRKDYKGTLIDDINLISYDINFGNNYLNYEFSQ